MELLTLGSQEEYDNFQTIYQKNINDFDVFTNVGGVKQYPSSNANEPWMDGYPPVKQLTQQENGTLVNQMARKIVCH